MRGGGGGGGEGGWGRDGESGGTCGQLLCAAVPKHLLCTRFWYNLQLVRSLIFDRFERRLHFTDTMRSKFA